MQFFRITIVLWTFIFATNVMASNSDPCGEARKMSGRLTLSMFTLNIPPGKFALPNGVVAIIEDQKELLSVILSDFHQLGLEGGSGACEAGPYNEVLYALAVKFKDKQGREKLGLFPVKLYLNNHLAVDLGRQFWGYPKEYNNHIVSDEANSAIRFIVNRIPFPSGEGKIWYEYQESTGFPGSAELFVPYLTKANIVTIIDGQTHVHVNEFSRSIGSADFIEILPSSVDEFLIENGINEISQLGPGIRIRNAEFRGGLPVPVEKR